MIKKLIVLAIFLISTNSSANCELNSFSKIIKINKSLDSSIIKSSNCSELVIQEFIQLIVNAEGKVNKVQIENYLLQEFNEKIHTKPKNIEVHRLEELIKEKYGDNDMSISNLTSLHSASSFNLDKNQNFAIDCKKCSSPGERNIKVLIGSKVHWVSAKILKKIKVLKVVNTLSPQIPMLMRKDFKMDFIYGLPANNYFNDIDRIQFYRLNKIVASGSILKTTDLTPKVLIRYGQKIKLSVKNKNIQLGTIGIAKKNGKLGEFINIENPKTKKVFTGRVIGHNKVLVEL